MAQQVPSKHVICCAFLFYLGIEMTKTEAKTFLEQLGVKVSEITDDVIAKVENAKAQLDTETRRKVRAFWIGVTAVGIVLGIAAGWFGRSMIG